MEQPSLLCFWLLDLFLLRCMFPALGLMEILSWLMCPLNMILLFFDSSLALYVIRSRRTMCISCFKHGISYFIRSFGFFKGNVIVLENKTWVWGVFIDSGLFCWLWESISSFLFKVTRFYSLSLFVWAHLHFSIQKILAFKATKIS
jgi:hypothetical protein